MESTPQALGVLGRFHGSQDRHTLSSTWCKLLRNVELAAVLGVARPGSGRNLNDRPIEGWSPTVLAEMAARSTTTPLRGYQYIEVREGLQSVPGLGEAFDKEHSFISDNDEPRYPKQRALAWSHREVHHLNHLVPLSSSRVDLLLQLRPRVPAAPFSTGLALSSVDGLRRQGTQGRR